MANFGPLTIPAGETWEIQAVCTGPGGTIVSTSFFATSDCGTTVDCQITQNPTSVSGPAGTPINLGGSATGAFQYEFSLSPTGPWTPGVPPGSIPAGYGTVYWRLCCVDNPTVCSSVATVQETVDGQFTTLGADIIDPDGNVVTTSGGVNATINGGAQ